MSESITVSSAKSSKISSKSSAKQFISQDLLKM